MEAYLVHPYTGVQDVRTELVLDGWVWPVYTWADGNSVLDGERPTKPWKKFTMPRQTNSTFIITTNHGYSSMVRWRSHRCVFV